MLDGMTECGNVTTVRALGVDLGSTHVKAAVVALEGGVVRELAVAERRCDGLDAAGLVSAAIDAADEALSAAGPVGAVGVASMAETGALVDGRGIPTGPLLRWDRGGDPDERLALARGVDPAELHAATGAPLVPKLPLLTWAALVAEGLPADARWAFTADLVAAALTGRVATDHTLAGRSGAYRLPAPSEPLPSAWDSALLAAVGVPRSLPPEVLAPGEPVGTVLAAVLPGAAGVPVHLAGHDHAVAAWAAGADRPGRVVHSLGTTEAVLALAADGHPVDRERAGREGISVVRSVDGIHEGVLAGSPAAGALIAEWRERARRAGVDPEALLGESSRHPGEALALPYPRGRQSPRPDPAARYEFVGGDPADPAVELEGILRGLAAHGAWMRWVVAELVGAAAQHEVAAVGTPVRSNPRLAGLMAAVAGRPIVVVDLAAPVASGAAMLAAERSGLSARIDVPTRTAEPSDDGLPDLAERFAAAVAASTTTTVPGGAA
jgi:xylulokinase